MRMLLVAIVISLGEIFGGHLTARADQPLKSTVCITDPSPFCETYRRLHGIPGPVQTR